MPCASTNSTNSCDFTKTNRMTNSPKDSDTKDLKPPVCPVGLVGHIEEDFPLSGLSPDSEQIIVNAFFKTKEYSEAQAQNWLDSEAPEEAKELYQEKFDRMHATIKDEDLCREKALLRTWEHYHRKEVA